MIDMIYYNIPCGSLIMYVFDVISPYKHQLAYEHLFFLSVHKHAVRWIVKQCRVWVKCVDTVCVCINYVEHVTRALVSYSSPIISGPLLSDK